MKNLMPFYLVAFLLAICFQTSAQVSITTYQRGSSAYVFDGLDKFYKDNFFEANADKLGLTEYDEMQEDNCYVDSAEKFHCRYKQFYKGYEVYGAHFLLHGEKGLVSGSAGNIVKNLNLDVSSHITEDSALHRALDSIKAVMYQWEDSITVMQMRDIYFDSTLTIYPQGHLMIAQKDIAADSVFTAEGFTLIWKFNIEGYFHPDSAALADSLSDTLANRSFTVYVDATTGQVVRMVEGGRQAIQIGAFVNGTCLTNYDGYKYLQIFKCLFCNDYRLSCEWGGGIYTTSKGTIPTNVKFQAPKDADGHWSAWGEQPSTTSHWAMQRAYAYFYDIYGRSGSDNAGKPVFVYTEVEPKDVGNFADYHDNDGNGKHDVDRIRVSRRIGGVSAATLDVIGHEYTHGFIRRNPNLDPNRKRYNPAGALNEGFADIFGTQIERYERGTMNWTIGEDVNYNGTNGAHAAIRDFQNPANSSTPQPSTYNDSHWSTSDEPHTNGGLLTHWYYLLSQGGTQNGNTVSGIGLTKSTDIAWVTMMWYLWPTVNYNDAAYQSLEMVKDRWGKCSPEYVQVYKAWNAVGINHNHGSCKPFEMTGPWVMNPNDGDAINRFRIISNNGTTMPTSVNWIVPNTWNTHAGDDVTHLLVDNVTSTDSKMLTAIVEYEVDNVTLYDTISKAIHIEEEDAERYNNLNVNNKINADNIVIFPNPVSNKQLNIYMPGIAKGKTKLEIFSATGYKCKEVNLHNGHNTINVDALMNGIYILKISGNANKVERITINN